MCQIAQWMSTQSISDDRRYALKPNNKNSKKEKHEKWKNPEHFCSNRHQKATNQTYKMIFAIEFSRLYFLDKCLCKFCVILCAIRAGTEFLQIQFNVFSYFTVSLHSRKHRLSGWYGCAAIACAYCRLSHKFIDMYNHKCSHSCRALDPNVYCWQFAIGITWICILDLRWRNRMIF